MREGEEWGDQCSGTEALERPGPRRLLGAREPVALGTVGLFWLLSGDVHDAMYCVLLRGLGAESSVCVCARVCARAGGKTWSPKAAPSPSESGHLGKGSLH